MILLVGEATKKVPKLMATGQAIKALSLPSSLKLFFSLKVAENGI